MDSKKEFFLVFTSAARKVAEAAWLAGSQNTATSPSQGEVARQMTDDLRTVAADYRSRADLITAERWEAINPAWGQPSENWEVADRLEEAAEGFAALAREWEVREASQLEERAAALEREAFLVGFDGADQNISEGESHLLLEKARDLDREAETLRRRAAALRART